MEMYRKIRQELNRRRDAGEANSTINYVDTCRVKNN